MIPEDVLERAKGLLKRYPVCDHCLGRAFLEVDGKNNEERGRKIREVLGVKKTEPENCYFCMGIFGKLEDYVEAAEREMMGLVFRTFRVGTHVPAEIIAREEEMWEIVGVKNTETIKKHVNREVGKILKKRTGKEYDPENPDVDIIIDVERDNVIAKPNPVYLYGRYRKLSEMPQSKWPCEYCGGKGCERCGYTGRAKKETVEYCMADVLLGITGGEETKLHAAGREDADILVLGTGRPFVIEIVSPRIRYDDWEWAREEINKHCEGRMEVLCLRPVERRAVRELKSTQILQTYRVVVRCGKAGEKTLDGLKDLGGRTVFYGVKKPRRKILYINWEPGGEDEIALYITCEQGFPIRQFIEGKTKPSLPEALGEHCKIIRIDIVDVHGGEPC
ncbi:MAG: tRNA pseudouridine synthase 10 [Candidatus Diapherotrites archaeon]|nr:tRNA pseudouridine synthase 10 [Candidatus Diapherotrites archaeon]MDN5366889.1 tRNA pseudouridine synthase 10 [Candidatus Diapherotrites archaeon]